MEWKRIEDLDACGFGHDLDPLERASPGFLSARIHGGEPGVGERPRFRDEPFHLRYGVGFGDARCSCRSRLARAHPTRRSGSGDIVFHDNVYEDGVPREALKKVGYIFQSDNLLPWRTVRKNLNLPLEILKLDGDKWNKRIDELLEMVGLSAYKEAYPHEMSGGMKQRIGVIRALVHDPDILLMDQPFGALDAITRKMLSYDFLSLWKKTQKTILMVTNDIDEALLLSSRIFIMSQSPGRIIHEINVDIPLSERNQNITKNARYNELRRMLKQLIKQEQENAVI